MKSSKDWLYMFYLFGKKYKKKEILTYSINSTWTFTWWHKLITQLCQLSILAVFKNISFDKEKSRFHNLRQQKKNETKMLLFYDPNWTLAESGLFWQGDLSWGCWLLEEGKKELAEFWLCGWYATSWSAEL